VTKTEQPERLFDDIGKHRFDMMVDGVFAIAMTLLVLDLRIPEHIRGPDLLASLVEMVPKFVTYGMAFCTLGVIWIGDMICTRPFRRVDLPHMILNVVALLFVALIPFTSGLMGSYPDNSIAVGVYGINIFVVVLMYAISMTRVPGRLCSHTMDLLFVKDATSLIWSFVIGAAAGPFIAIFSPRSAFYLNIGIVICGAVAFPVIVRRHHKRETIPSPLMPNKA
jgi:uncharacterized membrane protein